MKTSIEDAGEDTSEQSYRRQPPKRVTWIYPAVTKVYMLIMLFQQLQCTIFSREFTDTTTCLKFRRQGQNIAQRAWRQTKEKLSSLFCCIKVNKEEVYMADWSIHIFEWSRFTECPKIQLDEYIQMEMIHSVYHKKFIYSFWSYCRMLNVRQHLSWRFGYFWRLQYLNLASTTSGVLFADAGTIVGKFYFSELKEPHELSRKLSILQYLHYLNKHI